MTDLDIFEEPEPEVKRDRWGRYILPNPHTGQESPMTRATTFAGTLLDKYALGLWEKRMVVKGMSIRPDLVDLAASLDATGPHKERDKSHLDRIAEQAKDAAGGNIAAHRGTSIHTFSEQLDKKQISIEEIPDRQRPDLIAYQECMEAKGLKIIPSLIERVVCLPSYEIAGRLDKVCEESNGSRVVVDVKSGKDVLYKSKKLEIAVQLAIYAHGVNTSGVYNVRERRWEPVPPVREDYALVVHIPAGSGSCQIYRLDIEHGWEAVKLCAEVREARNDPPEMIPYDQPSAAPDPSPAEDLPVWERRFQAVSSRQEAVRLYQDARRVFPEGSRSLARLVEVGREALGLDG